MKCQAKGCCNDVFRKNALRATNRSELTTKYCRKHYRWLTERGTLEPTQWSRGSLEFRFWNKVLKARDNECWIWLGAKNGKGYGFIDLGGGVTKLVLAHRLSYQFKNGELTDADYVLHSCDTPSCVNPRHLRKGTGSENIKEAVAKGRKFVPAASGEANPKSKLTLQQVRFIKSHPELRHTELAAKFGVSPNAVRGVRIGRTWREV